MHGPVRLNDQVCRDPLLSHGDPDIFCGSACEIGDEPNNVAVDLPAAGQLVPLAAEEHDGGAVGEDRGGVLDHRCSSSPASPLSQRV